MPGPTLGGCPVCFMGAGGEGAQISSYQVLIKPISSSYIIVVFFWLPTSGVCLEALGKSPPGCFELPFQAAIGGCDRSGTSPFLEDKVTGRFRTLTFERNPRKTTSQSGFQHVEISPSLRLFRACLLFLSGEAGRSGGLDIERSP